MTLRWEPYVTPTPFPEDPVPDNQITKRRVTMTSVRAIGRDEDGRLLTAERSMTDYVPDDERGLLEPYLAAQRASGQWDTIEVSDELDAGPGGYYGQTVVPAGFTRPTPEGQPDEWAALEHADAGRVFAETHPVKSGSGGKPAAFLPGTWTPFLALQGLLLTAGLSILAIQTAALKNTLASAYFGTAPTVFVVAVDLTSTVPSTTAGTVLTGGSPAYARKAATGGAPANGVVTSGTMTFDVASGSTVAGFNCMSALSGGTYLDGNSLPSQTFASQGTYALTLTYTQG